MLNRNSLSPEQRVISARLELTRLEGDLKQIFRRSSKSDSIFEIALWHRRAKSGLRSPPHIADQLICAAAAYGIASDGSSLSFKKLVSAARKCLEVGNPAHLLWIDRIGNLEMLMPVMYREQIQLQAGINKSIYPRMVMLYVDLLSQSARSEVESAVGCSVLELIQAAYFLAVVSLIPLGANGEILCIDRQAIDLYRSSNFIDSGLESLFSMFSVSPDELGKKYLDRLDDLKSKEYSRSLKPLLMECPVVELSCDRRVIPVPYTLAYALNWKLGSLVRMKSVVADYSRSFATYVEKVLGESSPLSISRPDEEDQKSRKCDIHADFGDYELLIECKATRFTRNFISPDGIRDDTSTGQIGSACEQLHNSKSSNRCVSLVVVDDDLSIPNSDWFWEKIFERYPDARGYVASLGGRPQVWSLAVLESVVEIVVATGESFVDIINEYLSRPYHVNGEWETWVAKKRSEVDGSVGVELLGLKEDVLRNFLSFKSS